MKKFLSTLLPYPLFNAAFTLVRERPRAIARLNKLRETNLRDWREIDLRTHKTSDTLFILGSGASINAIPDEKWVSIQRHDSIGFNFWLCHRFVPTFYFFEAIQVNTSPFGSFEWRLQVLRKLMELLEQRADDYRGVPKFVDELHESEDHWHRLLPEGIAAELYGANTLLVAARSRAEARLAVRRQLRKGRFDEGARLGPVPKFGFTLGTLLSVAICLRYRKVVLCGVDLRSPGYFYQDERLYPQMRGFHSSPKLQSHMSFSPWGLRCSFVDYLLALRDEVMHPLGIQLFVESAESALFPSVALAPQRLFDESRSAPRPARVS